MAIWPFGRKSKRTSQSVDESMTTPRNLPPEMTVRESVRDHSAVSVPRLGRRSSRKDIQQRPRSTSRKLTKSNAASARDPEKTDSIPPIPALPEQRRAELNEKGGLNRSNQQGPAPPNRENAPSYYFQNPMSTSSLQPEKFSVVREPPTLQGKRGANDTQFSRSKSSKRKPNDHAREQEIKEMSSPIPIPKRPTSHQTGLLARESRKIPGGMNRNLDRPFSDVSLPLPASMRSQMSVDSDQHAFKVNAFAVLSPRPTIRYSGDPRSPASSLQPSRTSTRRDKESMIPEESLKSKKRIDELADDMDAGSLRELMERDRRRLEKHRRSEQERLERKLQRKADKQRAQEGEKEDTGQEHVVPVVPERAGSGDNHAAAKAAETLSAPSREERTSSPESWLKDPSRDHLPLENPFHDPVLGASTSHLEEGTPEERDDPVIETAKAIRLSTASMSPPASPTRHVHEHSNLSQFPELPSRSTPDIPEHTELENRRDSDASGRFSSNWKSIFRRSDTRAKRDSAEPGRLTPSEFSNASRESVSRQMPPSAFTRIPRARSGTPIRTQSRFKEDLPELPIIPDSRMHRSEDPAPSSLPDMPGSRGNDAVGSTDQPLSDVHPAFREEVAISRQASTRSKEVASSVALSQSLASVDSEGSWLTGRPVKRSSQPLRESSGSLQHQMEDLGGSDDEGPGTPEAEKYMGSLTPAREEPPAIPQRKRPYMGWKGGAEGAGDDNPSPAHIAAAQEEGTTWHDAVAKHPTIVRQGPGPRAKSREGLLNDFHAAEESAASSPSENSPSSPDVPSDHPFIQRATSVDLGGKTGHARHISAGSARLLNLPPRTSSELKRFSASSGERSPLYQSSPHSPRLAEETQASDVD